VREARAGVVLPRIGPGRCISLAIISFNGQVSGTMKLIKHILENMSHEDKTGDDVEYVEHGGCWCTWAEFFQALENFDGDYMNYAELRAPFTVVGADKTWWLKFVQPLSSSQWVYYGAIERPPFHAIPTMANITEKWP
jgi:hypothetical protein